MNDALAVQRVRQTNGRERLKRKPSTPNTKRKKFLQEEIDRQLAWMDKCGRTLEGYMYTYHEMHGRSAEEAKAIYDADMKYLQDFEQELKTYG